VSLYGDLEAVERRSDMAPSKLQPQECNGVNSLLMSIRRTLSCLVVKPGMVRATEEAAVLL